MRLRCGLFLVVLFFFNRYFLSVFHFYVIFLIVLLLQFAVFQIIFSFFNCCRAARSLVNFAFAFDI